MTTCDDERDLHQTFGCSMLHSSVMRNRPIILLAAAATLGAAGGAAIAAMTDSDDPSEQTPAQLCDDISEQVTQLNEADTRAQRDAILEADTDLSERVNNTMDSPDTQADVEYVMAVIDECGPLVDRRNQYRD